MCICMSVYIYIYIYIYPPQGAPKHGAPTNPRDTLSKTCQKGDLYIPQRGV